VSHSHAADDTVVDLDRLASFTQGDTALEAELAALYVETAQLYLARLRRAGADTAAWQRTAHALKGASVNIGALVVARLAAEQEQASPSIAALRALEAEVAAVAAVFRARGTLAAGEAG
jgi:HPt (histidine-containing phosphotransfer) domain-containing protein